jgi:sugar (pentulose or hexulose) kinase
VILLGLDVGTTSVKAATFDAELAELSHGRAPTPWVGTELDPYALLDAALSAAAAALPSGAAVDAIGVAGMAETGVLVDKDARPVVPSIAWHDPRGASEAARIAAELPDFSARTGLPPTTLCTLAKYAWMRAHWPDAARGTRWVNIAEWIVQGLGGDRRAESSLASRTGFYDLHTGEPWEPALTWADAPAGLAPPHVPAGTPLGRVAGTPLGAGASPGAGGGSPLGGGGLDAASRREIHARLAGAVLAVGGHDHLAAAVGAGAAGEGDVLDSCGTAEAILRATPPLPPDVVGRAVAEGFTVGWHAVEGRFVLQGAVWAGEALQAVCDLLGVPSEARDDLEAAALEAEPGPLALHGLDDDTLTITGLTGGASPGALYRATLERIGADGASVLARMEALAGPASRLVVTGGWAEGVAAQAVKRAHLGAFHHDRQIFAGAKGAAMAALRALRETYRGPGPL